MRKVLTIQNPWAFLIIRPDLIPGTISRAEWMHSPERKDVENRTWRTSYRGTLYIHVGKTFDQGAFNSIYVSWPDLVHPLEWFRKNGQSGGIIGKVEVHNCVDYHASRWFRGPRGLVLSNPEPVPFEPMPGRLGIFNAGDVLPCEKKET